jgi:hypothetical protein
MIESLTDERSMTIMENQLEMAKEIERLRKENESLKSKKQPFSMRISEKGGLSVYGLGRFPVTLYKEQWNTLIEKMPEIKSFMEKNIDLMKSKGE